MDAQVAFQILGAADQWTGAFQPFTLQLQGKEHYQEQQMLALGQSGILNLRANVLLGQTVPQEEIKLP